MKTPEKTGEQARRRHRRTSRRRENRKPDDILRDGVTGKKIRVKVSTRLLLPETGLKDQLEVHRKRTGKTNGKTKLSLSERFF